jgi:hypothetical protein
LGDREHRRVLIQHGPAVPELARQVHVDRDPGEFFQHVLADEPGVVCRAAGDDDELLLRGECVEERLRAPVEGHLPLLGIEPVHQRLLDRRRLLMDLLQHEVREAAFARRRQVPGDAGRGALHRLPLQRRQRRPVRRQLDDLLVVEIDDVARPLKDRGHIAREERLLLADADDERAAVARPEQPLRVIG